jgi:hypothetical protein
MKGIALKGRELALAFAAWATYVVSWFVPVIHNEWGDDIDAGWQAFLVALSHAFEPGEFWNSVLNLAGVLGNVPVWISPWLFRKQRTPAWFAIALTVAFLSNLIWLQYINAVDFLAGYWMWIASIGVLAGIAVVRVLRSRSARRLPVTPTS